MSNHSPEKTLTPRWLHYLAVLTVLATLPLLLLGAEVTSKGESSSMSDPIWIRAPWHLFQIDLSEKQIGFLIEHGHRFAGWAVGFSTIVSCAGLWWKGRQRSAQWLGTAALLGVGIQGFLGAFRVRLNNWIGPELAFVHGLFAQIVFALVVCVAVVTARSWQRAQHESTRSRASSSIRRWSVLLVAVAFAQILLGATTRRTEIWWAPRAHVLLAFVIVAVTVWLIHLLLVQNGRVPGWATAVGLLLVVQAFLGMEAWLVKFHLELRKYNTPNVNVPHQLYPVTGRPPSTAQEAMTATQTGLRGRMSAVLKHPDLFRSLHFLVGSLIFASTVALCLTTYHSSATVAPKSFDVTDRALEGAA